MVHGFMTFRTNSAVEDLEEQTRGIEYDLDSRNDKLLSLDQQLKTTQSEVHTARRALMEVEDEAERANAENVKKQELIESLKNSLRYELLITQKLTRVRTAQKLTQIGTV